MSQKVAAQIMSEIRDRGWRIGDLLGTEAELIDRFGVSRATLAEAVRQVERQGAATMRRGVHGGLTVTAPAAATIARSIATYLELSDVTLAEQFEAWRIIEVQAAGLAARNVTAGDIDTLRGLVARIDDAEERYEYLRRCMAVRLAVAERTHNPALALFLRVLVRVLSRTAPLEVDTVIDDASRRIRVDLGEMVEAVADGDVPLAQGIARMNLAARQEALERRAASQGGRPSRAATEPGATPEKLAETVLWRIRDDIAELGWPEGARLGDEGVLLQRYGVSRWVLRQAVRTLEAHGIVRSKRGQGGGLLIGHPDPGHMMEATVGYFQYTDFKLEDVADVWANLLESAVQLAGAHAPGDPAGLLASIAAEERARGASEARRAAVAFYGEIGRLSHNRVIALFLGVLARFVGAYRIKGARPEILVLMRQRHAAVGQALVAGEGGRARRLIADYQELMRPYYTSEVMPWGSHVSAAGSGDTP